MWNGIQKFWNRQSILIKSTITICLSVASGGGIAKIEGISRFVSDQIANHLVISVSQEAVVGNWGKQQFWEVDSTRGVLRLSATPPCEHGTKNCFVTIKAQPSAALSWTASAIVFIALFLVLYSRAANKYLGPYSFIRGKSLKVNVSIDRDGAAEEVWTYGGVTCSNKRYPFRLDYSIAGLATDAPKLRDCNVTGEKIDQCSAAPNFTKGATVHTATVSFADHLQPPFTFTIKHSTEPNAWALNMAEFRRRYPDPNDQYDVWEYEAVHYWEDVSVTISGLQHLTVLDPVARLQRPGQTDVEIPAANWAKTSDQAWNLTVENVAAQSVLAVKWKPRDS